MPASLKDLLTTMTAVHAKSRPHLSAVEERLLEVGAELSAAGSTPRFIMPLGVRNGGSQPSCGGTSQARGSVDTGGILAGASPHAVGAVPDLPSKDPPSPLTAASGSLAHKAAPPHAATADASAPPEPEHSIPTSKPMLLVSSAGTGSFDVCNETVHDPDSVDAILMADGVVKSATNQHQPDSLVPTPDVPTEQNEADVQRIGARDDDGASMQQSQVCAELEALEISGHVWVIVIAAACGMCSTWSSADRNTPARSTCAHAYHKQHVQDVSHIHTVEDLLVHLSAGPPGQFLDFDWSRTLRLTSNWKAPSDSLSATWAYPQPCAAAQLGQGGGVVANVTLDLAGNGALLLHGSSQLRLRNCVIQGVSACQRQQRPQ